MPSHIRRIGLIALGITIGVAVAAGPVAADPISDAQAQAAALQSQISADNQRISVLGEQYDGAQYRLTQAEQAIADSTARIEATQHQVDHLRQVVRTQAADE